jgi:hypothetical protein
VIKQVLVCDLCNAEEDASGFVHEIVFKTRSYGEEEEQELQLCTTCANSFLILKQKLIDDARKSRLSKP